MLRFAFLATLIALLTPPAAEARLFWQTYGAIVPADGACGAGCHWNLGQDYFVPRHCDTGQYGLFSPCKVDHYRSPACKNLHPVYAGYCTPYGSCRYKWRDHVYKTHCGCTPLKCVCGPWHLQKCGKHALVKRHAHPGCPAACGLADSIRGRPLEVTLDFEPTHQMHGYCQNLEPFGGENLGSIAALPAGMVSAGTATTIPTTVGNPLPPKLELVPSQPAPSPLPAPFDF
jgi:hypothetical protein